MPAVRGRRKRVRRVEVGDEFRACPKCGCEDGFHCMFRPSRVEESLDWLFICPSCSSRFDIGLKLPCTAAKRARHS